MFGWKKKEEKPLWIRGSCSMELICSEYESDQSFALTEFQYEGRKFLLGSLVVPPNAEECKENISLVSGRGLSGSRRIRKREPDRRVPDPEVD